MDFNNPHQLIHINGCCGFMTLCVQKEVCHTVCAKQMAAATLNRWRGRTFKWKLVFWYLCSLLLMSTSWTVQIRNIWTYGSANGGSSSVQVSRKNIRMEKIFWYLGSIFSLDLVNVYLKNSANPNIWMDGSANGGGSSVQVATIRSCSGATARRWPPPALLSLLLDVPRSYERRLEAEQPRKAKSNSPPALFNLRDITS